MRDIFQFVVYITLFIDRFLVPLIFTIAFIVFIWGVFNYFILGGANQEKREEGKKFVMYGLIGFVIMVAIWGIVILLANSTGLDPNSRPRIPTSGAFQGEQQGSVGTPSGGGTISCSQTNRACPDPMICVLNSSGVGTCRAI
jgi:hypothetical protein